MARNGVFISYSHKDRQWRDELKTMLDPFIDQGLRVWDDTEIQPGEIWEDEIKKALGRAKVAVLVVTKNFFASEFIKKVEWFPLLDAAQKDGATIFWIYFGSCNYENTQINAYQAAYDTSVALNRKSPQEREAILSEVCVKLDRAANA